MENEKQEKDISTSTHHTDADFCNDIFMIKQSTRLQIERIIFRGIEEPDPRYILSCREVDELQAAITILQCVEKFRI